MACLLLAAACARPHAPAPEPHAKAIVNARPELTAGVRDYRNRRYRDALGHFNRAVKADPANIEAHYDRGLVEQRLRDWPNASRDFRFAVRAKPKWTKARLRLAVAQYHARQFEESAHNFDIVERQHPTAKLRLDAGVSYFHAHRWSAAAERFRRALALRPRSGRAHYWLGMTYKAMGQKRLAIRELRVASRSKDPHIRVGARTALAQAR